MTTYLELTKIRSQYTTKTIEDLELLTVNPKSKEEPKDTSLRGLASLLGIQRVNQEDKELPIKKAKKEAIKAAIWQVLEDQRKIDAATTELKAEGENASVKEELIELALEIWRDIQQYVETLRIPNSGNYREIDGRLGAISLKLVRRIETRENQDGARIESTTVTRYVGEIKKMIRDSLAVAKKGMAESTAEVTQKVADTLLGCKVTYTFDDRSRGKAITRQRYQPGWVDNAMAEHTQVKNHRSNENKQERSESASVIKALNLIDWAVGFLTNLNSQTKAREWIDVVVAIALLTGRRMGEVVSEGSFTETDNPNHLLFSGQMKGKTEDIAPAFEIPVLGLPSNIVKADQWLRDNNRKFPYNKRATFSKSISETMGRYDAMLTYKKRAMREVKPSAVERADKDYQTKYEPQKLHFHGLRKIYAQIIGSEISTKDRLLRIAEALGDTNDPKTTSTYDSDFQVIDAAAILDAYYN